jgi:hypothetical protein
MRNAYRGLVVAAALCIILTSAAIAEAAHRPVIVVVANYLSLDDFINAGPSAKRLVMHSAISLVNTGPDSKSALEGRYLAMASGFRAETPRGDISMYRSYELVKGRPAAEVYASRMGRAAPAGSALCLGLPRLLRANKQPAFREECIGLVGGAFHKAGLRTAVIGNSDMPGEPLRLAGLLAMDRNGVVDAAALDADPGGMARSCSRVLSNHSVVVVDFGRLNRLEAMRQDMTDQAYEKARTECLLDLDTLLGALAHLPATLIVCSPCRAQSGGPWSNLTPVVEYTGNGAPGLLTSATTRTPGLISNIDIAPTILRAAGLPVPESVTGRPVAVVPGNALEVLSRVHRLDDISARNYAIQIPVLIVIGAFVILSAMLSEAALRLNRLRNLRRPLRQALFAAFALPAGMLLVDGLRCAGIIGYFVNLAAGMACIVMVAWLLARAISAVARRPVFSLGMLMLVSSAVVLADVLTGAKLMRWSMISCDPITGIRYYGIGNEYMGALIGASLFGPILLMRTRRAGKEGVPAVVRAVLLIWFAYVAFAIGYPRLGANVGGLITCVAAFGAGLTTLSGMRIRGRHVAGLLAVACAAVGASAAVDVLSPGGGSHLGRSIQLARIYGWDWLGSLIGGKLLMHLGILKLPQTYWPILVSIPLLVLYGRRVKAEMPSASEDLVYRVGLPATLVGMAAAFVFNDSGIVPAAFMLAFLVLTTMYLRLSEGEIEIHGA